MTFESFLARYATPRGSSDRSPAAAGQSFAAARGEERHGGCFHHVLLSRLAEGTAI
jgi:hypothetical protein